MVVKKTDGRRKYENGYKKITRKTQKWDNLWDQIYDELDSSIDWAVTNREFDDPQSVRFSYDMINVTPQGYIQVSGDSFERLSFARKIAEHYKVKYIEKEDKYTKNSAKKFIGTLMVSDTTPYIMPKSV